MGEHKLPKPTTNVSVSNFDERTTSDLAVARFSGLRVNQIMRIIEVWVVGRVQGSVSFADFERDPHALTMQYCQVFGLNNAELLGGFNAVVEELAGRKEALQQLDKKNPRLLEAEQKAFDKGNND